MRKSKLSLCLAVACILSLWVAPGYADPTDRFDRPIPMGVSIGNTPSLPFIYTGAAGMRVFFLFNPAIKFILSNNHVLGARGPTLCPDTAPSGPGLSNLVSWILEPIQDKILSIWQE
jgi:hypothetical protein